MRRLVYFEIVLLFFSLACSRRRGRGEKEEEEDEDDMAGHSIQTSFVIINYHSRYSSRGVLRYLDRIGPDRTGPDRINIETSFWSFEIRALI